MLRYDEATLVCDLAQLGRYSRVAFAAACAERVSPSYEEYSTRANRSDGPSLGSILAQVWEHLLGNKMSAGQIRAAHERCMALMPDGDDQPWVEAQAYADDAAAATAYTLRVLESGEPQDAAWAARRAYEAADYYVVHRLGIHGESQVTGHPIVQAEFSRQRRDIEELRRACGESTDLFVCLRDRAKAEAKTFFGSA